MLLVFEGDGNGSAVFILDGVDEALIDAVLGVADVLHLGSADSFCGLELGNRFAGRIENDGVEAAVPAAYGSFAVGLARVKIDAVARAENLAVAADLNLKLTVDDDVDFLTGVRGELNRL